MSAAEDLYVQYAENSRHLMWIADILMCMAVTVFAALSVYDVDFSGYIDPQGLICSAASK